MRLGEGGRRGQRARREDARRSARVGEVVRPRRARRGARHQPHHQARPRGVRAHAHRRERVPLVACFLVAFDDRRRRRQKRRRGFQGRRRRRLRRRSVSARARRRRKKREDVAEIVPRLGDVVGDGRAYMRFGLGAEAPRETRDGSKRFSSLRLEDIHRCLLFVFFAVVFAGDLPRRRRRRRRVERGEPGAREPRVTRAGSRSRSVRLALRQTLFPYVVATFATRVGVRARRAAGRQRTVHVARLRGAQLGEHRERETRVGVATVSVRRRKQIVPRVVLSEKRARLVGDDAPRVVVSSLFSCLRARARAEHERGLGDARARGRQEDLLCGFLRRRRRLVLPERFLGVVGEETFVRETRSPARARVDVELGRRERQRGVQAFQRPAEPRALAPRRAQERHLGVRSFAKGSRGKRASMFSTRRIRVLADVHARERRRRRRGRDDEDAGGARTRLRREQKRGRSPKRAAVDKSRAVVRAFRSVSGERFRSLSRPVKVFFIRAVRGAARERRERRERDGPERNAGAQVVRRNRRRDRRQGIV